MDCADSIQVYSAMNIHSQAERDSQVCVYTFCACGIWLTCLKFTKMNNNDMSLVWLLDVGMGQHLPLQYGLCRFEVQTILGNYVLDSMPCLSIEDEGNLVDACVKSVNFCVTDRFDD